MNEDSSLTRVSTVSSYSERGSQAYEDPMNKNFLYGQITVDFIHQINFPDDVSTILDIGCGTGFIFDEIFGQMKTRGMQGVGIEPAEGMLRIAMDKYKDEGSLKFQTGSFEDIPLEDKSVDKIVSTLALHWVKSLKVAAEEMRRVLKVTGSLDILMIGKDDGATFKKCIVEAQKKHLTFAQIMKTAVLVQRVNEKQLYEAFEPFHGDFDIKLQRFDDIVYGTFEEHMKWWKARSAPVIADVENKELFMQDLETELNKITADKGIPFDTSYYWITVTSS